MARRFGFLLGAALILALPAFADVSVQAVTGPVAAPDVPGTPSHNYIFFASNHDLAAHGYVEEEFFIKGNATTYNISGFAAMTTATVKDTNQPYYTRVVVRRPADARRFNGIALAEWYNVTNQFDAENVWFFDWEHIMSAGYVWVGVSPQTVGIAALKKWSPTRYGEFDVGKVVASTGPRGGPDADAMSYDIFSQVGEAIRHPADVDMLHGLKPKLVIATGESQSASRLATYINAVHPTAKVYDGFLLLSAIGSKIREDLISPVIKVNMEHDTVTADAAAWQSDTPKFRSWDVAGTSHVDRHLRESREPLELRDNGLSLEAKMAPLCSNAQVGTRTPAGYVVGSAFDKLAVWAAGGKPPPSAPRLKITQVNQRPAQSVVARNSDMLAQGGIQLSEMAVPTQVNFGVGAPADANAAAAGGEAIGAGACVRWGYSVDMSVDTLNAKYPSHAAYVAAVTKVADQNVKDGYILPFDAATTIREAKDSHIGK